MIGLDTNILVRYLTQDDAIQSPRATEIIERRLTEENPGFVSIVAMVETVWVLDRAYRLAANEIAAAVERMLQTDVLVVENEQEIFSAMIALKQGQVSLSRSLAVEKGPLHFEDSLRTLCKALVGQSKARRAVCYRTSHGKLRPAR
jgi:predicted nucleic-acid-binding protein